MSSAREDQTVVNIRCAEWVGKPGMAFTAVRHAPSLSLPLQLLLHLRSHVAKAQGQVPELSEGLGSQQ